MSVNLTKALGWSALLHLLVVGMLWFTHQPTPVLVQPQAIEAFVYQPVLPKQKPPQPVAPEPEPVTPLVVEAAIPENLKPEPPIIAEPQVVAAKSVKQPSMPIAQPEKIATEQQPTDNPTTTTAIVTTPTSSAPTSMTLAERSIAIATSQQTNISSATLQAIQQRPEQRDRAASTSTLKTTPDHVAANVLQVLSDRSFIEKVGDYCYQAEDGADLRADISSMKPVPCGEDKNTALYNRIMSKVGQDR